MNTIFCIEDEDNIRELLIYTLEMTGFHAKGFAAGDSFWEYLSQNPTEKPDLILLDVMLPGESGLSILQKIRERNPLKAVPVIMLTAKSGEIDKVSALDRGADDYITKPFGMMELVSRIRAVLRRCGGSAVFHPLLTLDGLSMDDVRHEVTVSGRQVNLTLKEYELLKFLMNNPDIVLTRSQLQNQLWGYDYSGESRTLDVHIATLRQKLGEAGDRIETVRGVGYRMRSTL